MAAAPSRCITALESKLLRQLARTLKQLHKTQGIGATVLAKIVEDVLSFIFRNAPCGH